MDILRWPSSGAGRSKATAFNGMIWTVANTPDGDPDFGVQVAQSLAMLDTHLMQARSSRHHILSLQVLLADIGQRSAFDQLWQAWIGPNPAHWPQRACFQAQLAPGVQLELVAVAAAASHTLGVVSPN